MTNKEIADVLEETVNVINRDVMTAIKSAKYIFENHDSLMSRAYSQGKYDAAMQIKGELYGKAEIVDGELYVKVDEIKQTLNKYKD